jgi:hypothetical protein
MFSKSINFILLFSILANRLRASSTSHSISTPSQPKSSSRPLAFLEKRGRSATRLPSSSSVDFDSTNPPEPPVLNSATFDDGGNKGQKKKLRSDEQRLKRNKEERNRNALKREVLKGDPDAMAAAKEKTREKNAKARTKRLAVFKDNPKAKIAWNLKRTQCIARRKAKQISKFGGDLVAIAKFELKEKAEKKRLNSIEYLKRKERKVLEEKKGLEANSNPPMSLRLEENEVEDWMDDNLTIKDTEAEDEDTKTDKRTEGKD